MDANHSGAVAGLVLSLNQSDSFNRVPSWLLQEAVPAPAEPPDRSRGPGQPAARHSQLVPGAPAQGLPAGGVHRPAGLQEAPHIPLLKQSGCGAAQSEAHRADQPQRGHRVDGRRRPEELPGPGQALPLAVCRGGKKAGTGSQRSEGTRGFGGATAD